MYQRFVNVLKRINRYQHQHENQPKVHSLLEHSIEAQEFYLNKRIDK